MYDGYLAEAPAIRDLAGLVERAGYAASVYRQHLERPDITASEAERGALGIVTPHVDGWLQLARRSTKAAEDLGISASEELARASEYYHDTDQAAAADLDRQYPHERSKHLDKSQVRDAGEAGDFDDWKNASEDPRHPGRTYGGPPEADAKALTADEHWPVGLEETVAEIVGAGGTLGGVVYIVQLVTGKDTDPFKEMADAFLGDWEQLHRQSILFSDASKGFDAIHANIDHGRFGIQDAWEGNAAANAENWLARYSKASMDHSAFLAAASARIRDFAQASYHYAKLAKYYLGLLFDLALELVALTPVGRGVGIGLRVLAYGAKTFGKLAGGVGKVGGLLENLEDIFEDPVAAASLIASMHKVVQILGQILSAVLAKAHTFATATNLVSALLPVEGKDWPRDPYDHPEV